MCRQQKHKQKTYKVTTYNICHNTHTHTHTHTKTKKQQQKTEGGTSKTQGTANYGNKSSMISTITASVPFPQEASLMKTSWHCLCAELYFLSRLKFIVLLITFIYSAILHLEQTDCALVACDSK